MRQQANYDIIEDNVKFLCIQDVGPWDTYQSVTNAAEQVVEELADQLNGRRLLYIDTDGQRDELLHENGKFTGFKAYE